MSGITFRYEQSYSFMKKGIKHTIKENVIDGPKGVTIMFLEKKGDEFYKMYAKEVEKDNYEVAEKKGETEQPLRNVNEKELIKMLKEHKLDTIVNYMTKERGTYKGKKVSKKAIKISGYGEMAGGAKKRSKKSSKKSSKK
jgi:hypothetical protein